MLSKDQRKTNKRFRNGKSIIYLPILRRSALKGALGGRVTDDALRSCRVQSLKNWVGTLEKILKIEQFKEDFPISLLKLV